MSIEIERLSNIIEAALLAFGQPLSVDRLIGLFSEDEPVSRQDIREALQQLQQSCEGKGIELVEVGSGFRYQARKDYAKWVAKLWEEKPPRYSRALLETLVLVAYRQPITRAEIEDIRGVSVSSHIMKTLQERDWVRVVGHKDVPGKPALYATTKAFLDYFNLKSLDELPSLMEIRDLDKISAEIDAQGQEIDSEQVQASADAQQLLDSEDEERLFADGDVDHGDGIEDSMDTSVAAPAEDTTEQEIPDTESVEETMTAAAASAETAELPETLQSTQEEVSASESLQNGQLQDKFVAVDGNTAEFVQADSREPVDDLLATTIAENQPTTESAGVEAQNSEAAETVGVEFSSKHGSDTADTVELLEQADGPVSATSDDDGEQGAGAVEDIDASAVMHNDNEETVSIEGNSAQPQDVEHEHAETVEMQSEEESESVHETRFSTANYGLRESEHEKRENAEQQRDQSEYAEEEHDHHSDRLSAAEPNT
jgi:segregation and condensation protein B